MGQRRWYVVPPGLAESWKNDIQDAGLSVRLLDTRMGKEGEIGAGRKVGERKRCQESFSWKAEAQKPNR